MPGSSSPKETSITPGSSSPRVEVLDLTNIISDWEKEVAKVHLKWDPSSIGVPQKVLAHHLNQIEHALDNASKDFKLTLQNFQGRGLSEEYKALRTLRDLHEVFIPKSKNIVSIAREDAV